MLSRVILTGQILRPGESELKMTRTWQAHLTLLGVAIALTSAAWSEKAALPSSSIRPATGDVRLTYTLNGREFPLRLFVPASYDPLRRYPAVVALHGGGVDENSYFDRYERGRIKQVAEAKGMMVLCPRRPRTTLGEEAQHVGAALHEVAQRYSLDRTRLYLLGHSAGGSCALYQAAFTAHPFAAVASLAGAGFLDPAPAPRGLRVPVFLAAATGDEVAPVNRMRRTRDRLNAAGVAFTYHETQGSDHNAFVAPLFEKVFDWFLTHRLPGESSVQ